MSCFFLYLSSEAPQVREPSVQQNHFRGPSTTSEPLQSQQHYIRQASTTSKAVCLDVILNSWGFFPTKNIRLFSDSDVTIKWRMLWFKLFRPDTTWLDSSLECVCAQHTWPGCFPGIPICWGYPSNIETRRTTAIHLISRRKSRPGIRK